MKHAAATMLVVVWTLSLPLAAAEPPELTIEATPLGEGVFMLSSGAGGNLALVVAEGGALLVDSEYEQLYPKVRTAIDGLTPSPIRWLVNTHWHFDHVGGNQRLAEAGALIIAHANARRHMTSDTHIDIIDRDVPASPDAALPVLTLTGAATVHVGGATVELIPFAGHTDGDLVVRLAAANVIHVGDLFFNCGYPFIDVANGGDVDDVITSLEAVLGWCDGDTRIIPGHGPLATRDELAAYVEMLRDFRAIVAAGIAAGKDLETIQASGATAELDAVWATRGCFPSDQFTEMVFRSIN